MATPVTFSVTEEAIPALSGGALEGVTVRVYSEDGLTFVTQGTTDSDGELVLELADLTTYWVRFFKETYSFDTRLLIDVDSGESSNTFDVEGQYLLDYPPSANTYLCRASGYVRGADWAPKPGVIFTFMLTGKPRVVAGQVMVAGDVTVQSKQDGWVEVELVRNSTYDVLIPDLADDTPMRVQVPDSGAVSITELIWPYIAQLDYSPTSLSLAIDEEEKVTTTVTLSSGVTTPFEMDGGDLFYARSFLQFSLSDDSIVNMRWSPDDDALLIEGKKAGTTTLTATIREDAEADRKPDPTRSLASLTITVTG